MATKTKVVDAQPKPGRTQKAVVAGPAGKQLNADGSKHSSKTDGGKSGLKI
jgi:hypothetical protein